MVKEVGVVPKKTQKGEADSIPVCPSTLRWVGVVGVLHLLTTLKVMCASMEQFATNIRSKLRNSEVRGIIEMKSSTDKTNYWAVFDDLAFLIEKNGNQLAIGSYVKLYGNCDKLIVGCDEDQEFRLLDPQNRLYHRCEKLAKRELLESKSKIISSHQFRSDERGYSRFNQDEYSGYDYHDSDYDSRDTRYGSRTVYDSGGNEYQIAW
jgi:hypothetical protein